MPTIPISTLPSPPKDTSQRVGHVWAHETMIPIVATRNPKGLFVRLNIGHETLGENLRDISQILTKKQVEDLVRGIEVQL